MTAKRFAEGCCPKTNLHRSERQRVTAHLSVDAPFSSVADREAAPFVGRLLQLIHQSDGVVFQGDAALTLAARDELVGAETELTGAFAGLEESRGLEYVQLTVRVRYPALIDKAR